MNVNVNVNYTARATLQYKAQKETPGLFKEVGWDWGNFCCGLKEIFFHQVWVIKKIN